VQIDEAEKLILDFKEKIEFYRSKMQDLVSSCCSQPPPPPSYLFLVFFSLIPNFCQYLMHEIKYVMKIPSLKKRVFQTWPDAH
jgi:hypothetical protein